MIKKLSTPVYVTQPALPPLEEYTEYLHQIWESKWITNNGRFHRDLEKALSEYLEVDYISLFSNGTLALLTALQALDIKGEVITTPYSFVATTHALWWNRIKPVFIDVEPDYCNINPENIEAAVTSQTTAILPVHVYGNPCNVDTIKEVAELFGLKVIYDACHTFGVRINGIPVLRFGDLSVMSFHATKVFTTFEGGAIICHDEATKKKIDNLKNFGFENETSVVIPGINAKMNEVQAAIGLLQLKYIEEAIHKRKLIAIRYREELKGVEGIKVLPDNNNINYCYSYFPIFIDKHKYGKSRDQVYEELKSYNIYGRRYFYPLISQFPIYQRLESARKGAMPVAERLTEQVLCLPIYPDLQDEAILSIISILNKQK